MNINYQKPKCKYKGIMTKKSKEIKVSQLQQATAEYSQPAFTSWGMSEERVGSTTMGRNRRGPSLLTQTTLQNRFVFIDEIPLPFIKYQVGLSNYITIRDVLLILEKAYFGFPLYRNTVETQVELCNTDFHLVGGNKQSRSFINKWLKRINSWSVADQWFRDYFWKGNVFPYRIDAGLSSSDIKQMQKVYGITTLEETSLGLKASDEQLKQIPISYLFLPPENLVREQALNYGNYFYKMLNAKEIDRLLHPKDDDDKEFAKQFNKEQKEQAFNGQLVFQKVDPDRIYCSTYKCQSYYPFGVPFGYAVLSDINYKLLLNKLDEEIAKTLELILLHIRVGDEKTGLIAHNNIQILQGLFVNPKVQRVLVTDYTVNMEWKVPPIEKILGPEKHLEINRRLQEGLFSALWGSGEDKFASLTIKAKVFIEKLNQARRALINDFLQPEIKRLCQVMGFKSYPEIQFVDISLEDEATLRKIYAQFYSLGALTPQEAFKAVQEGILPNPDEALENQQEYKKQRDSGLFQPLLNQKQDSENGRPSGSKSPQTTKKIGKIGTKAISLGKIIEVTSHINLLEGEIDKVAKSNKLEVKNKDLVIANILFNETEENWHSNIKKYIEEPDETIYSNKEFLSIKTEFDLDNKSASILLAVQNNTKV